MGPYVMTINIKNKTNRKLKPLGTAFYDGDGDVQQQPQTVEAESSGSGGVLEKVGGSDGLWGLVAYSTPDKSKMLVIYTTMPALAGTDNHCWVGLVQAGTNVNSDLATTCYEGPPTGFSESEITREFTDEGDDYLLTVTVDVADKRAYETSSNIRMKLFKKPPPVPTTK